MPVNLLLYTNSGLLIKSKTQDMIFSLILTSDHQINFSWFYTPKNMLDSVVFYWIVRILLMITKIGGAGSLTEFLILEPNNIRTK